MTSTWLQSWLQDQPSKGGQQQQRWAPGGPGSPSAHPIGGAASIAAAAGAFTEAVEDVEVTFRPSSVLAAALATPVHSWFANPLAFGGADDGGGSPTRAVHSSSDEVVAAVAAWGEGATAQPYQQQRHQMPPAPVFAPYSGDLVPGPQQRWVPQDQPEADRPSGVNDGPDLHSMYSSGPNPHTVQSSYPSIPPTAGRQQQDLYAVREQQQYNRSTFTVPAGNVGIGRTATVTGGNMETTFTAPAPSLPPGAGLHSSPNDQQLLWALERRLEGRVEELGLRVEGTEAGLQGARWVVGAEGGEGR